MSLTAYQNPFVRQLNQKPQGCFSGFLGMSLTRRLLDQKGFGLEDIGSSIGMYIDERDAEMYMPKLQERALDPKDPRVGVLLTAIEATEFQESLKTQYGFTDIRVVRPKDLGLRLEDLKKRNLDHVRELIWNSLKENKDLGINMHWAPFKKSKDGHYVYIAAYDPSTDEVYVADSSPNTPDFWKHKLINFAASIMPIWPEVKGPSRERAFILLDGPINRKQDDPKVIEDYLKTIPTYTPFASKIIRYREDIAPEKLTFKRQSLA